MRIIIHFTGCYIEKYGSLERFFCNLINSGNTIGLMHLFVFTKPVNCDEFNNQLKGKSKIFIASRNKIVRFFQYLFIIYINKPSIIQTHFDHYDELLALLAAFLCGIKCRIFTVHIDFFRKKQSILKCIYWILIKKLTTQFVACGTFVGLQIITRLKLPKNKVFMHYFGVEDTIYLPSDRERIRKELGINNEQIVITCTAFHSPIKGVDLLLQAYSEIIKKYPNCILLQIGKNPEEHTRKLRLLSEKLGIIDKMRWLGLQNDVPYFLCGTDIYVQPSRTEALGLAVVEAFSAGLPVITSAVGGLPELVKNEYNGLLFPKDNVQELVKCLERLILNKTLRMTFGKRNRILYLNSFESKRQLKVYNTFYQSQTGV